MSVRRLALFDLDNTLLTGDTDVLWIEYLSARGKVDTDTFARANADMERRYKAGLATAEEFCGFYVSTLGGKSPQEWAVQRDEFFREWIHPRIPQSARNLVDNHRQCGDVLLLTTATNRFLTEPAARDLGIEHLLATEVEKANGVFTGKTHGVLNMREGKVTRLAQWLHERDWPASLIGEAIFYSDSINDLPLLESVARPIAVDPDPNLTVQAKSSGWEILHLAR